MKFDRSVIYRFLLLSMRIFLLTSVLVDLVVAGNHALQPQQRGGVMGVMAKLGMKDCYYGTNLSGGPTCGSTVEFTQMYEDHIGALRIGIQSMSYDCRKNFRIFTESETFMDFLKGEESKNTSCDLKDAIDNGLLGPEAMLSLGYLGVFFPNAYKFDVSLSPPSDFSLVERFISSFNNDKHVINFRDPDGKKYGYRPVHFRERVFLFFAAYWASYSGIEIKEDLDKDIVKWAPFIVEFIDKYTRGTKQADADPTALAQLYAMVIVVSRAALGIDTINFWYKVENPTSKYVSINFNVPKAFDLCPPKEFVSNMKSVMYPKSGNDGRFVLLGMLIDDAITKNMAESAKQKGFLPLPSIRNIHDYFEEGKYPSWEAIQRLSDRFYWRQALVEVMQKFSEKNSTVPMNCLIRGLNFLGNWGIVGDDLDPGTRREFKQLVWLVNNILPDGLKGDEPLLRRAVSDLVHAPPFFPKYR